MFKKAIDQYIQDTIQVFQVWHNLCAELTSILAIQKQPTNRPQLIKSDRPQVNIWDIWKTLKYLNINDSFHLKDLEISKYKRFFSLKVVDLGYPKIFPIIQFFLNLHHGIGMSKYIICQSFKKFHRAVFSIAHPKYSNFGGILDARW